MEVHKPKKWTRPGPLNTPQVKSDKERSNYKVSADICEKCGDLGHRGNKCRKKKKA